jgi:hypothetical protein
MSGYGVFESRGDVDRKRKSYLRALAPAAKPPRLPGSRVMTSGSFVLPAMIGLLETVS